MNPTGHERLWTSIPPVLLTAPGGSDGKVQVTDTEYFRVNMKVVIGDPVLPHLAAKVARVDSPTEITLIPEEKTVGAKEKLNLSAYGITSFVYANEQTKRYPSIKEIEESMFEGEPVMARRSVLVDKYGRIYGSKLDPDGTLRLATDTSISVQNLAVDIQWASEPEVVNQNILLANTEYSFVIPQKTQRFTVKIKDAETYYSIKTTSGGNEFNMSLGQEFDSGVIDSPANKTYYIEAGKPCQVDIFIWKTL